MAVSRDRNLIVQRSHIMFTVLKTGRGRALHGIVCGLVFFAWVGGDARVAAESIDARAADASSSPRPHRAAQVPALGHVRPMRRPGAGGRWFQPCADGSTRPGRNHGRFSRPEPEACRSTAQSALREEAEKLKARLTKVEAGVLRLDHVLEAIKRGRGANGSSVPRLQGVFPGLSYFLQPFESTIPPPEGATKLDGKNVVILCKVNQAAAREYPSLDRDIVRNLGDTLQKKVKKIIVVDPDKLPPRVSAHPGSTEPADAARDFGADVAISLEVEQFQSQSPGDRNMLQGESKVHIQVFELDPPRNSEDRSRKESHNVYDAYAESTFPKRGPLPVDSGTSGNAFARTFAKIVAKEISWHFVEHLYEDTIQ